MTRNRILFAASCILFLILYHVATRPIGIASTEMIRAEEDPIQNELNKEDSQLIHLNASGYEWTLKPQANFRISARILGRERYRTGWQASASPEDLAMAWGKLQDPQVDRWIHWSQAGRWYFYRFSSNCPYSQDFITSHSANIHIIPSTKNLRNAIFQLEENDRVTLEGLLVNATVLKGSSSYWWNSSLSRSDTGDNSCELFYVKKLITNRQEYR